MSKVNLEKELRDFQSQRYPSVDQILKSNADLLYRRKKFFLSDLRCLFKLLGFMLIVFLYFRDLSIMKLALRAHIQNCLSNPYPKASWGLTISDKNKKSLRKFLLKQLLLGNAFCFIAHILFDKYPKHTLPDGYTHGSMTIQFIGERSASYKFEILLWDVLICFCQLIYLCLMCAVDDSKVLEVKVPEGAIIQDELLEDINDDSGYLEGDGYGGNVNLLTLDLFRAAKTIYGERERLSFDISGLRSMA